MLNSLAPVIIAVVEAPFEEDHSQYAEYYIEQQAHHQSVQNGGDRLEY